MRYWSSHLKVRAHMGGSWADCGHHQTQTGLWPQSKSPELQGTPPPARVACGTEDKCPSHGNLFPQQGLGRESSMIPSPSSSAVLHDMGAEPGLCWYMNECSAELLQLHSGYHLTTFQWGKQPFRTWNFKENCFPTSQLTTSLAEHSCAPNPSSKPDFPEAPPELPSLPFAVLVRNHISC